MAQKFCKFGKDCAYKHLQSEQKDNANFKDLGVHKIENMKEEINDLKDIMQEFNKSVITFFLLFFFLLRKFMHFMHQSTLCQHWQQVSTLGVEVDGVGLRRLYSQPPHGTTMGSHPGCSCTWPYGWGGIGAAIELTPPWYNHGFQPQVYSHLAVA